MQVKIIANSISKYGKRLTTWELVYPRIIHAELMTHKMLSKNAASSRAIPVSKVIEMVRDNPAMPVRFGAKQPGMQDKGFEHNGIVSWFGVDLTGREAWEEFSRIAADASEAFDKAGYAKQVCNRVTEPYQWMKTVLSGTEFTNFFWLRDHEAADPTLAELAWQMRVAYEVSEPVLLEVGEWHMPYYGDGYWKPSDETSLDDAMKISMSCSAQVSYRTLDDTMEKAERVVERLNLGDDNDDPKHASPSEHQGTPMDDGPAIVNGEWQEGVTAVHKELGKMSGNLAGWIQYRQLIPGHTKW